MFRVCWLRWKPRTRLSAWMLVLGLASTLGVTAARVFGQPVPRPPTAETGDGPEVEESSEVANLLRTAEDAIAREDWKLAIDSLQRVIEEPWGLRPEPDDPSLFTSPRRWAYAMLASLPAEGLRAYAILFNGRAKGLLERARREHDPAGLRTICDLYLLTRQGPEAANLLASWLLDVGREAEALSVLDGLMAVYPMAQGEAPDGALGGLLADIEMKRAVAAELLGDWRTAAERLNSARRAIDAEDTSRLAVADAVQAFIAASRGSALSGGRKRLSGWSGPGGGGANLGRMDAVIPSFAESSPWVRPIPSIVPGVWPDLDVLRPDMLLVTQPVVSDGRVFVKAGRECMAIDLESFAVLWTATGSAEGIAERASGLGGGAGIRGMESGGRRARELDLVSDYVGQSLTTSHGLVFSVERGDAGASFAPDGVVVIQRGRAPRRNAQDENANRLAAYDAETGVLRWQRGRGTDSDERLRRARFLAPAVGVGAEVWAPFESSGDLYVAAFDPKDGGLKGQVFLCALGDRPVNDVVGLFPAVADGHVYVPTDQGMLFAISAADRSIRWASRYRSNPAPRGRNRGRSRPMQAVTWLSGPPVVVGGLLLLGPTDDDRLLAFDQLSGRLLWELPRGEQRYIIGADRGHVWLGGASVSRVSLREPGYEWETEIPETTGRAVLSGGTIYVPTRSQLVVIDAETGTEREAMELPGDQPPLGNLLCVGDVMISLDPSTVRSFPDRNSYDATLAAHLKNPSDGRTAIRLAFMELLNHRPRRALEALDGARLPGGADAELQRRHVAHLRVESLMQLGDLPDVSGDEAVASLRRAVASAVSPTDQVHSRMALGRKLQAFGRFKEAYRTLFELGVGPLGERLVGTRPVRRVARLVVADRLRRIEPELGAGEHRSLSEVCSAAIERASSQLSLTGSSAEGVYALQALADTAVIDGWDQAALNRLGRFALRRGKYERAEQYLNESVRRSSNRKRTAEALLTLLDMYLEPSQALHRTAGEVADRLMREFSDVTLDSGSVASLVAERRRRIDAEVASSHAEAMEPSRFVADGAPAFQPIHGGDAVSLVSFRGDRPESLAERLLVFSLPRTARCYHTRDGSLEWESELRLLDDFAFETAVSATTPQRNLPPDSRTALTDGQTVVISSAQGLHAVGAITGRGLWAISFQGGEYFGDPTHRSASTDVADGRVACMLAPRTLAVFRAMDGKQPMAPIWRRNMGSESMRAVRIREGKVLAAGPRLERVHVFQLETGAELCQITFHQPDGGGGGGVEIPLAYANGVLSGPEGRSIVAYDTNTGEQVWSLPLPEDPVTLFEPAEGRLVVGGESGYHWLLDTRSGDVLLEGQYDALRGGAADGVLESGVLLLSGVSDTKDGYRWNLVGVDPSGPDAGRVVWNRDLFGTLTGPYLQVASGVIPMVTKIPIEIDETNVSRGRLQSVRYRKAVMLIDKRTGETIGAPLMVEVPGEHLTGELAVWPGRLVLQTTKGLVAFRTTTAGGKRGGSAGVD